MSGNSYDGVGLQRAWKARAVISDAAQEKERCQKRIMKETDLFSTIHHSYKKNRTLFVKARVRDVAVAERDERLNELDVKSCMEIFFFRSVKGRESVRLRSSPEASLVRDCGGLTAMQG